MSTIQIHRPCFYLISSYGMENHHKLHTLSSSWKMTTSSNSPQTRKTEELSVEHQKISSPQLKTTSPFNLRFDRLQPLDQEGELIQEDGIEFGQFVVREALLEEEFWTAAWLRAEIPWEDQTDDRHVENYKRKLAEQEFNGLKRRSKMQLNKDKCSCIVTVKKEERNVTPSVLKSAVGTLDLSVRYFVTGETFPGEQVKGPLFYDSKAVKRRYAYIANLCVAKSSRRQGVASNMLLFAINLAKSNGAEQVFVQVLRSNKPALELYQKIGFQVVERANAQLSKEGTYMLCFK